MPRFGRPRHEGPDVPGPADEAFDFFTVEQASRFRYLVRQGFAEAGIEVTTYADHLVDADGRRFGLANLAAACHNDEAGESDWPGITREHAARVVRSLASPSPFLTLPRADLLAATYLRVVPTADYVDGLRPRYASEIAPGLLEVLSLDLPESVALYLDEHVSRMGVEDLRAAGTANLRALRPDHHERFSPDGGQVDVLVGESMFIASQVLCLAEVAARTAARPVTPELGVFFAVPTRHKLEFHVLGDASCVPSLDLLASVAAAGYRDGVGAMSPDVYWWRPGTIDRLTTVSDDGVRIEVGPALDRVLAHLCNG